MPQKAEASWVAGRLGRCKLPCAPCLPCDEARAGPSKTPWNVVLRRIGRLVPLYGSEWSRSWIAVARVFTSVSWDAKAARVSKGEAGCMTMRPSASCVAHAPRSSVTVYDAKLELNGRCGIGHARKFVLQQANRRATYHSMQMLRAGGAARRGGGHQLFIRIDHQQQPLKTPLKTTHSFLVTCVIVHVSRVRGSLWLYGGCTGLCVLDVCLDVCGYPSLCFSSSCGCMMAPF